MFSLASGCLFNEKARVAEGRAYSQEKGWEGLDMEPDENANASLCYTCVPYSPL